MLLDPDTGQQVVLVDTLSPRCPTAVLNFLVLPTATAPFDDRVVVAEIVHLPDGKHSSTVDIGIPLVTSESIFSREDTEVVI